MLVSEVEISLGFGSDPGPAPQLFLEAEQLFRHTA